MPAPAAYKPLPTTLSERQPGTFRLASIRPSSLLTTQHRCGNGHRSRARYDFTVADRTPNQQVPIYPPDSDHHSNTPQPPASSSDTVEPAPVSAAPFPAAPPQPPSVTPSVPTSPPPLYVPRGSHDRPHAYAPSQVLGRRQLSDLDESGQDEYRLASSDISVSATSSAATTTTYTSPRPLKRRRGIMSADVDGQNSSNGLGKSLPNGSRTETGFPTAVSNGNGALKASGSQNGSTWEANRPKQPLERYHGHNREQFTRLIIQAITEMGYNDAAEKLSQDSGYRLENPTVAAFRAAVLDGDWGKAEELLNNAHFAGIANPGLRDGLILALGADRNMMKLWLRQQKYLELLERRETSRALMVLRTELTPLCGDQHQKLEFLSSLLMCTSAEDLKDKAEWDGARGESRHTLLSELSKFVSPSVMLPEHRLAALLNQAQEIQISNCLYHSTLQTPSLYKDHVCDRKTFPAIAKYTLDEHNGNEVWQVKFSHDGTRLASCGMERLVVIYSLPDFKVIQKLDTGDEQRDSRGVGNISWSPDDKMLVTCGMDAKVWDTETGGLVRTMDQFNEPVSSCAWVSNQVLITGSFDKERSICSWNLGVADVFKTVWTKDHRTEDLALSPDRNWVVALDDQKRFHVYNYHTREQVYSHEMKDRGTSLCISQDSASLLVNTQVGTAVLYDIPTKDVLHQYNQHKGGDFLIRTYLGGANEAFVLSGSEDGSIYIYHKTTGILVARLKGAHSPRCNSVNWNPSDPRMIASCGDDGLVKIWYPEWPDWDEDMEHSANNNGTTHDTLRLQ
ncbi:WD40-repeat-containing domain protein [Pseudoneurospora amorphoporcata]|uniref:WD40-repeat-containing domain protein n=1 Tax=Pseudoneurospora amorphoporcata TaxID=241081 RepID=A0AAN6NUB8_9PEZI|nr:WD40-repeat-containing domain protein [Pseudoneurospora amorphoporcata]